LAAWSSCDASTPVPTAECDASPIRPRPVGASLAESTRAAHSGLWLISAGQRPTSAIAQLLEARPHEQSTLNSLINRWRAVETPREPEPVPLGHGSDFPAITPRNQTRQLTRGMPRPAVREIINASDQASTWATAWLERQPQASYQDLADAVYRLAAGADTASELLIRALAAVNALRHVGVPIKCDLFKRDMLRE